MFQLTPAQQDTLNRMPRYRAVAQLRAGAAIVICDRPYHEARVIAGDGRVYAISRYLAILGRRT